MDLGGWPAEMEKSLCQRQGSHVPGHISYISVCGVGGIIFQLVSTCARMDLS